MIKPFVFISRNKDNTLWSINFHNNYKVNYALLINNNIIRIVEINFSFDNIGTQILRDIISLANEEDIKELLKEFKKEKHQFDIENFWNFIKNIQNNKTEKKEEINKLKFFLFIALIYELNYNRELKYSLPNWFRENFYVKALMLKVKYIFAKSYNTKHSEDLNMIVERWLGFCLDNWNISIDYPPLFNNFPEGEIKDILHNENEMEILRSNQELMRKALVFYLKRYDLSNAISMIFVKYRLYDILSGIVLGILVMCTLLSFIASFQAIKFPQANFIVILSNIIISIIMLFLYIIFFIKLHKIFLPRALFGASVGWIVLISSQYMQELPNKLKTLGFSVESFSIFIVAFSVIIIIYIISEMEEYIRELPIWQKALRAFILLLFIYNLTFIIGIMFDIDTMFTKIKNIFMGDNPIDYFLITATYFIENLYLHHFFTIIVSFIAIATQIMWEDKPMTEV